MGFPNPLAYITDLLRTGVFLGSVIDYSENVIGTCQYDFFGTLD